jgi:hypothetical protein
MVVVECKIEEIEGYFVLCRRSREFAVPFSPRAVVPSTSNHARTSTFRCSFDNVNDTATAPLDQTNNNHRNEGLS